MEFLMKPINNGTQNKKKLYLIQAISGLVLFTVYCLIIGPIMSTVVNDVRFEGTPLSGIIEDLGMILEVVSISVCCGIVTLGLVYFGARKFAVGGIIYCGIVWYKYVLSILLAWIDSGSIPLMWYGDLGYTVVMAIVEIIPFLLAWFLVGHAAKNYAERNAILARAGKEQSLLPYKSIFDISNPLLRSAFICSIVVFATKFAGRFFDDLLLIITTGLPKDPITVLMMLLYYFSSIIYAVLCYFAMLLTIHFVGIKTVNSAAARP